MKVSKGNSLGFGLSLYSKLKVKLFTNKGPQGKGGIND